jgi:hypothetical protein
MYLHVYMLLLNTCRYETVATLGFLHGRTETCRSLTPEVVAACDLLTPLAPANVADPAMTTIVTAAAKAVRVAAKAHTKNCLEAAAGQGIDRHLFGLTIACAEILGEAPPALLRDRLHTEVGSIIHSLSSLVDHCTPNLGRLTIHYTHAVHALPPPLFSQPSGHSPPRTSLRPQR